MSGLRRFSVDEKIRITKLKDSGKNYRAIAMIINRDRPIDRPCTWRGVMNLLWRQTEPARGKRGYKVRRLGPEELSFIDAAVDKNREISGPELQKAVQDKFNIIVSLSAVNKERLKLGWVNNGAQYCKMIPAVNEETSNICPPPREETLESTPDVSVEEASRKRIRSTETSPQQSDVQPKKTKTDIAVEEQSNGSSSNLHPNISVVPYRPTKSSVLEILSKLNELTSVEEQQSLLQSFLFPEVATLNSAVGMEKNATFVSDMTEVEKRLENLREGLLRENELDREITTLNDSCTVRNNDLVINVVGEKIPEDINLTGKTLKREKPVVNDASTVENNNLTTKVVGQILFEDKLDNISNRLVEGLKCETIVVSDVCCVQNNYQTTEVVRNKVLENNISINLIGKALKREITLVNDACTVLNNNLTTKVIGEKVLEDIPVRLTRKVLGHDIIVIDDASEAEDNDEAINVKEERGVSEDRPIGSNLMEKVNESEITVSSTYMHGNTRYCPTRISENQEASTSGNQNNLDDHSVLKMRKLSDLNFNLPPPDLELNLLPLSRTSTPSQSGININNSSEEYAGYNQQSVADDICSGCRNLQKLLQRTNDRVWELERKLVQINKRFDGIDKGRLNKSENRPVETYSDNRLLRVKAAAFITGRPLSPHMCKQLVLHLKDNEPLPVFDADVIKGINDRRECRDAPSLTKWAVFELFSVGEMVGRNCLGGGRTTAGGTFETKKPFDEIKMEIIKNAVFQLYPQNSDLQRKSVWMKGVDKVNTDVRYLFKLCLKKHEWLQLDWCFNSIENTY